MQLLRDNLVGLLCNLHTDTEADVILDALDLVRC